MLFSFVILMPSMILFYAASAAFFYGLASAAAWRGSLPRYAAIAALAAIVLHAVALTQQVYHAGALSIGVSEAASLFTWQAALLLWGFCFREPLHPLGTAVYPLAAIGALTAAVLPSPVSSIPISDWQIQLHIVLSLFSAGLLTLAAAQAVVLALQDRMLHQHKNYPVIQLLPPLQTMERILFQLISLGFFLLSLTLISGLLFIRDWFAQHLAHKTVLSITAWLIFGVLLWGRRQQGWRGRTAIRWALAGYGVLILAYFGSKLVLEQILGSHWS